MGKRLARLFRAMAVAIPLAGTAQRAVAEDLTDLYRCVSQPILDLSIGEAGEWRHQPGWSTSPYILSHVESQRDYHLVRWAGSPDPVGYRCNNPPVDGVFYCGDFTVDTNTLRFTRLQLRGGSDGLANGVGYAPADGALLELGFCEAIPPGTPSVDFSGVEQPQ